ncbi:MAG: DUF1028 domain-containing protein [Gammaproteobacteria bacterium]|nr:DUF1028 domain-containing protein [Gammaproteobacteria bacterium]
MTFSIAGRCGRTGMLGVAITTSSISVGARCPWVRAGCGAVSTQNITDPELGPVILDALAAGRSAEEAVADVMRRPHIEYRQLTVVDGSGEVAHFTGEHILGIHAVAQGDGCVAAGNLLAHDGVARVMVETFTAAAGRHLAQRLLDALAEGVDCGGEQGPVHSAALTVAHEQSWPLVDLRVDWEDDGPVARLQKLWRAYEPQMEDYLTRAANPAAAPSYGVAGDP